MNQAITALNKISRRNKEASYNWVCRKCGFSHSGEYPTVKCHKCHAKGEAFEGVEE